MRTFSPIGRIEIPITHPTKYLPHEALCFFHYARHWIDGDRNDIRIVDRETYNTIRKSLRIAKKAPYLDLEDEVVD
jgi:hypothetical protein